MADDAWAEFCRLPAIDRETHEARIVACEILVRRGSWGEALELASILKKAHPEAPEHYIQMAFCLHEMKRTVEARAVLLEGPTTLREQALFYYNLACYQTQLGEIEEAQKCLRQCFKIDEKYRQTAAEDPDLEPLRKTGFLKNVIGHG